MGRRIGSLGLTVLLLIGTLVVGWLVWSVVEWRHGRTPSYRLLGLRVVGRADGQPDRLLEIPGPQRRLCLLLVVPTVVIGAVVGLCFAMGASPPDGLLSQPRAAPWDLLTATTVMDERVPRRQGPAADEGRIDPVGEVGAAALEEPRQNGHVPG